MNVSESQVVRRELQDQATLFATREMGSSRARRVRDTPAGFDAALWKRLAQLGWLGIVVPEHLGGSGLGFDELAGIARPLAAALMPEPYSVVTAFAARTIVHGDNEALKSALLPAICNAELIPTVAWQEAPGALDPMAVSTTAKRRSGQVSLSGRKLFVPHAAAAHGLVVSARSLAGVALYWVPTDHPGVRIEEMRQADGTVHCMVTFDDARVATSDAIATTSVAPYALSQAIDEATVMIAVELLGVASRSLEITLEYLRTRSQFGKPIGSFQALQHRAVDLYVQKELAVSAVDAAIAALGRAEDAEVCAALASRAKARCSDFAIAMARDSIQMHGAIGWTDECDVSLYAKRALVLSAYLGNSAAHRRRYAMLDRESHLAQSPDRRTRK